MGGLLVARDVSPTSLPEPHRPLGKPGGDGIVPARPSDLLVSPIILLEEPELARASG